MIDLWQNFHFFMCFVVDFHHMLLPGQRGAPHRPGSFQFLSPSWSLECNCNVSMLLQKSTLYSIYPLPLRCRYGSTPTTMSSVSPRWRTSSTSPTSRSTSSIAPGCSSSKSTSTSASTSHPYKCEICGHALFNPFRFYSLECHTDARDEADDCGF